MAPVRKRLSAAARDDAAGEDDAKPAPGAERQHHGGEVEQPRHRRERQADQHRPARPVIIAQGAGAMPRRHRGERLQADDTADHERAEAEHVVDLQRQRRERYRNREKAEEHRRHQRREAPEFGGTGEVGRLGRF